ncbi:hypothetical protein [Streptomyces zagrosensis]|uniref:Uncharacterized PurR-regulated membrane protein YhhQ (DUF165 family) n=1 Tax=Streptomyces zagrosensis TaxID=1042984 RepID=A0A7W9QG82_9ACTN|nr:hypothetical protein [Streptomyces zagrosensis]MBB5939424.1 uncharacterized PurR-regulated membrane protein YhhQ (DUF165 family) [Streptomyces zagrosensis]
MSAPLPKAATFAVAASFGPWVVGALLSFVLIYAGGYPDDDGDSSWETFSGDWLTASALLFPLAAALVIGVLTRLRPTPHRWLISAQSTVAYAVVLLVVSVLQSLADGDGVGQAVDYGFVMLIIALFTLQLPLCAALSAALARPLGIAETGGPTGGWAPHRERV